MTEEFELQDLKQKLRDGEISGNIYGFSPDEESLQIIKPSLRPLAFPVELLKQDPANARYHSRKNKAMTEKSIKDHGMRQSIVARVETLEIEAGNLRHRIFDENGWKWIPTALVDDDSIEAAAFGLADNRTAELGEWDMEVAVPKMEMIESEYGGVESTGFTSDDWERMRDSFTEDEDWGEDLDDVEFGEEDKMFGRITVICPPEARDEVIERIEASISDLDEVKIEE